MIPVFRPAYDEKEAEAVRQVLMSGWVGLGPKTEEFEKKFAAYIGVEYGVGLNSCTAALHLALLVLDIEGREVITTPVSFVSTNHAILYSRGIPKFCDVEPDTLNIDTAKMEALISPKTKAILVVHYAGHACDMDKVMALARKHKLAVVEDCAHATGGEYKGKKLGSFGDLACFSFHAVKNLAAGEGGLITAHDEAMCQRLRRLRWLGIDKGTWQRGKQGKKYDWQYDVQEVGYKCHLHDISAAIALVQLEKLDGLNARRREIVKTYDDAFKSMPWIERPAEKPYARSSWHIYGIKLDKRDDLNVFLQQRGIATGVHYYPNHLYSMYEPYRTRLPVAESVWQRILTLPNYPDLKPEEQKFVIDSIREFGAANGL